MNENVTGDIYRFCQPSTKYIFPKASQVSLINMMWPRLVLWRTWSLPVWAGFLDQALACKVASAKSLHCFVLHSPDCKVGMITSSADDKCERRNKCSHLTFVRMQGADLDLHNPTA